MINKKAQSQIITTVLIILLVLAAIVIVWQVVNSIITGGAESIKDVDNCFDVTLEIIDDVEIGASAGGSNITVKRGPGSGDLKEIAVVVAGTRHSPDFNAENLVEFDSDRIEGLTIVDDNEIEIYAIVGDSKKLCAAVADTRTA